MTPHILIVDTDASAARITRAGVERVVPEATLAVEPDPERGWLSFRRHCPDVLIIDPPRHNLAGALLIKDLKQAHPEAQVIVLASTPTPSLRRTLQQIGADAYLEKPAPLAQLMEAVLVALGKLQQPVAPGSAGV